MPIPNRTARRGVLLLLIGTSVWLFHSSSQQGAAADPPATADTKPGSEQPGSPSPANERRRMDLLRSIDAEFGVPYADPHDDNDRQTITGTIRMADGSPLPADLAVEVQIRGTRSEGLLRPGRLTHVTTRPADGRFEAATPFGYAWLTVNHPELGPSIVGPLLTSPGGSVKHDFVLDRGFTARVRVVDQEGRPVAGARLGEMEIYAGEQWIKRAPAGPPPASGSDGVLSIPHCSAVPTRVCLVSDEYTDRGFDFDFGQPGTDQVWSPDRPIEHRMSRAMPVTGRVLLPDATPAAGAKLVLTTLSTSNPHGGWTRTLYQTNAAIRPIGVADAHGDFRITSIAKQGTVGLMALAADGSRAVVPGVKAGTTGLVIRLRRPATLRLTLTGSLDRLPVVDGKPTIWFGYEDAETAMPRFLTGIAPPSGYHSGPPPSTSVEVRINNGIGKCEISNLFTGSVELDIGGGRHWQQVAGEDIDTRIAVGSGASRDPAREEIQWETVTANLVPPPGREPPQGFLRFVSNWDCDGKWRWSHSGERFAAVHDAKANLTAAAPNNWIELHSDALIGYTFDPKRVDLKLASSNPPATQSTRIDLRPAGAIYGSVGLPGPNVRIYAEVKTQPPQALENHFGYEPFGRSTAAVNEVRGTYVIHSAPLNTHVGVYIEQWVNGTMSKKALLDDVVLTEETPAHRLDLAAEMLLAKPAGGEAP